MRSAVAKRVGVDKGGSGGRSSVWHRHGEGVVPKPAERVAALGARSGGEGRRVDEDVGLRVAIKVGYEELLMRCVSIVGACVGWELAVRLLKEEFAVWRMMRFLRIGIRVRVGIHILFIPFILLVLACLIQATTGHQNQIVAAIVSTVVIRKNSGRSTKVG